MLRYCDNARDEAEPNMRHIIYACLGILGVLPMAVVPGHAARTVRIAFVDTGSSLVAEALAKMMIANKHLDIQVISPAFDFNPHNVVPEPDGANLLQPHGLDV